MILKFQVSGANKEEIKLKANVVIGAFLGSPTPGDVKAHFEVSPLVSTFHDQTPERWSADVQADV